MKITETMASLSREDDEGYNGFRTSVNTEISDRADRAERRVGRHAGSAT